MRHNLNMLGSGTVRLSRTVERVVYGVGALLLVSGVAWLLLDSFVLVETEFGPSRHPAQAWILKAHGVLALFGVWGFGVLWPVHIRRAWAAGRHRKSGAAMFGTMTVLAVTGLLLYYAGTEALRAWSSVVHWVVGVAGGGALVVHAVLVPRWSRASNAASAPPEPSSAVPLQPSGSSSR